MTTFFYGSTLLTTSQETASTEAVVRSAQLTMREEKKQFGFEERERNEKPVKLTIREPDFDKNFMVAFEGRTTKECEAYNWAISEVLSKAQLSPFHQIGTSPNGQNEPGYHAWEVWRKVSREQLEILLPQIEDKAKEYLIEFDAEDKDSYDTEEE